MPFATTGIPELERLEPPNTIGTLRRPEVPCLSIRLETPGALFRVVKLALSDNACLMSILSRLLATVGTSCSTRLESPTVHVDTPGRLLLPGQMSNQRSCTSVSDPFNQILASLRQGNQLTSGSILYLDRPRGIHHLRAWTQSTCQAGLVRWGRGFEPHRPL